MCWIVFKLRLYRVRRRAQLCRNCGRLQWVSRMIPVPGYGGCCSCACYDEYLSGLLW
jgi:hypothetical protein